MLAVSCEYTFVQELISIKLCANKLNLNDTETLSKLCEKKSSFKLYETEYLNIIQWYNSIFYLFPLIFTTIMSSWTDHFGRRFVLMVPVLFSFFVEILLIYTSTQILQQNIIIYILSGALISGVSGSSSTIISSTHSYLTNHIEKSTITKRLTILEACIFFGGFLGFNLTSFILKYANPKNKFLIGFSLVAFMQLLILLYIKFFLQDKDERTIKFGNLIKVDHFLDSFKILTKPRSNFKRLKLFILYYCGLSSSYALSVQQMLLFTYLKSNFQWQTEKYSDLQGRISLMNGLTLVLIFPIIQFSLQKLLNSNLTTIDSRTNMTEVEDDEEQQRQIETNEQQQQIGIEEQQTQNLDLSNDNLNEERQLRDIERQTPNLTQNNSSEQTDLKIDTFIVGLGFLSKFLGLGLLGILADDKYMFLLPILLMFNEFSMPGIRSMIAKTVDTDEKGKAFGLLSFTRNFCYFTGSFLFKYIYTITRTFYKGLTFESISMLQVLALLLIR